MGPSLLVLILLALDGRRRFSDWLQRIGLDVRCIVSESSFSIEAGPVPGLDLEKV